MKEGMYYLGILPTHNLSRNIALKFYFKLFLRLNINMHCISKNKNNTTFENAKEIFNNSQHTPQGVQYMLNASYGTQTQQMLMT